MPDSTTLKITQERRDARLKLPAMYTLLRARRAGESRYRWTGYIYDISTSGMRFELDEAIEPGTQIEVRGLLPAGKHTTFRAVGRVVRIHDEDEPQLAPVRMAMCFDAFTRDQERQRLVDYLSVSGLRTAA